MKALLAILALCAACAGGSRATVAPEHVGEMDLICFAGNAPDGAEVLFCSSTLDKCQLVYKGATTKPAEDKPPLLMKASPCHPAKVRAEVSR